MTVDDVGKKEREEKNKDDGDKNKANRRPLKRSLWISTGPIGRGYGQFKHTLSILWKGWLAIAKLKALSLFISLFSHCQMLS